MSSAELIKRRSVPPAFFIGDSPAIPPVDPIFEASAATSALIESIKDHAIFMLDTAGYVRSWGAGAEQLKGYKAAEVIGRHVSIFHSEADRADGIPAIKLQKALNNGLFHEEGIRVRKDGSRFMAAISLAPLYSAEGAHIGFSKVVADISARLDAERTSRAREEELRRANASLHSTNAFLQMAEEMANLGYWHLNMDSEVIWSDEVYRIHGLPVSPGPIDVGAALAAYHPDDRDTITRFVQEAFDTGNGYSCELRVVRPDGTIRQVAIWGKPEFGSDGAITGQFGVFQDITERKNAERLQDRMNKRIRLATEAGQVGIWEWDFAEDRIIADTLMHLFFTIPDSGETLSADDWFKRIHSSDASRVIAELAAARSDRKPFDTEFRVTTPAGETQSLRANATLIVDAAGKPTSMVGVVWDVSEARRLKEQLFQEKERLRITLASIGDAVVVTDNACRVTFANSVAEKLLGWTLPEAMFRPLEDIFHIVSEETGLAVESPIRRCLAQGTAVKLEDGITLISRNGARHAIQDSVGPVRTRAGEIVGAVLVFQDVSQTREKQKALSFAATHDTLTGLYNRAKFEAECRLTLAAAHDLAKEHTLCFIDLDRFKMVNDTGGHAAGDMMLKEIARVLTNATRSADILARLGGDEFGLLLRNCDVTKAEQICGMLISQICAIRLDWEDKTHDVGASIGVVAFTVALSIDELLGKADAACYISKHAGRNRVSVHSS